MNQIHLRYVWQPYGEGWNRHVKPGRWVIVGGETEHRELFSFLLVDLEYRPERVRTCIEMLEGCVNGTFSWPPVDHDNEDDILLQRGVVDGGNDGTMYYGGGHVLIISDYAEEDAVVLTAEQALIFLSNVLTSMELPTYNNPHAAPPEEFTMQVIATGKDAPEAYYRRGGFTPVIPEEYRAIWGLST